MPSRREAGVALNGCVVHRFRLPSIARAELGLNALGRLHLDEGEHAAEGGAVVRGLCEVVAVGDVVVLAALRVGEDARVEDALVTEVRRAAPEVALLEVETLRPHHRHTVAVGVAVVLFVRPPEGGIDGRRRGRP